MLVETFFSILLNIYFKLEFSILCNIALGN